MVSYLAPGIARADGLEEFSSELEKFASHLVLENQSLQHENKQLGGLLKEYESTLENVMSKFRGVAVSLWEAKLVKGIDNIARIATTRLVASFLLYNLTPITSNRTFIK